MSLWNLRRALLARSGPHPVTYRIPRVWSGGLTGHDDVDPYSYYQQTIDEILARPSRPVVKNEHWTNGAHIYNLFVRAAASFDHDGDGLIGGGAGDLTCNHEHVRGTGPFLKAVAMLPHIQRLGCDTVYLLPITAIGHVSRKGLLGSPYAIRNPMVLDEYLADPLVPDLTVDEQFAAFTSAAHHLGLRVVLEFVFRTSAQDGDWVAEHPDWYYWIKADVPDRSPENPDGYGNPPFPAEAMVKIKKAAEDGTTGLVRTPAQVKEALDRGEGELIEPPDAYRAIYTAAPKSTKKNDRHYWIGTLQDGTKARIPGAFADWPPDDVQPPWTDVTYLRMYGKPGEDFDYMAYNTIRLYDPRLAVPERANTALWDAISAIVPSYQDRFGIDGVMVDMGHALPVDLAFQIQRRAREKDARFAFWEEKFFLDPVSPATGYEAVVGPGIFTLANPNGAAQYLRDMAVSEPPTRFFATGENHNTPRLPARAGIPWTKAAWALALFLPGAVPFVHNGVEVLERVPLNTGLCFSKADLEELKDTPLGLFDASAFDWERNGDQMIPYVAATMSIHRRFASLLERVDALSYRLVAGLPAGVLGYQRLDETGPRLAVLVNSSDDTVMVDVGGPTTCLLTGETFDAKVSMTSHQVRILTFD